MKRYFLVILATIFSLFPMGIMLAVPSFSEPSTTFRNVQEFLQTKAGVLKNYTDQGQSAAMLIENSSRSYGINPYMQLIILEATNQLLSNANPTEHTLRYPYTPAGPEGFAAQIEWASRELRAGLGPYDKPPIIQFTDGTKISLSLDQAPEGIAIQRFLAIGRTAQEWRDLNSRFVQIFENEFHKQLPEPEIISQQQAPTTGFLQCPWPIGMKVVHLAYFDHAYPTVDTGSDGNSVVVTYVGPADVQYNAHDGHDYFFPDNPVGTPILAAAAGKAYARTARGNGVYVVHPGGYETVYWHLNHFAPKFRDIVDSPQGIWVEAGDMLGTSGTSGFSYGTPHLHFEVRLHGKQVDPYGWYGPGDDLCNTYAGCTNQGWLWDKNLYGSYDFTPPNYVSDSGADSQHITPDLAPPMGTLSVNPPTDLLLLVRFDGHTLQEVGKGQPTTEGVVRFDAGRYDRALSLPEGNGLTYPISGNFQLEVGTIMVWANIPEHYPSTNNERHYLFAASANPEDDQQDYPGTFALRRDMLGADHSAQWNFWTKPQESGNRHDLTVADTLTPGWHHIALTWDRFLGRKEIFFDGARVASAGGVILPADIGNVLQIGRFSHRGNQSGMVLDELAIFSRVLSHKEIDHIAQSSTPLKASDIQLENTKIVLDTNAADAEGMIVAVQIGIDGSFGDPQPYYDGYRWNVPAVEGEHTLAARYFDRASNRRTVTQTVTLNLPPRGSAVLVSRDTIRATIAISATDMQQPIDMQISQSEHFHALQWEPFRHDVRWIWKHELGQTQANTPTLYVRFRDAQGHISEPIAVVTTTPRKVYIPFVMR